MFEYLWTYSNIAQTVLTDATYCKYMVWWNKSQLIKCEIKLESNESFVAKTNGSERNNKTDHDSVSETQNEFCNKFCFAVNTSLGVEYEDADSNVNGMMRFYFGTHILKSTSMKSGHIWHNIKINWKYTSNNSGMKPYQWLHLW